MDIDTTGAPVEVANLSSNFNGLFDLCLAQEQGVFRNHEKYSPNKELMRGLGDEAVASGYGSSEVAFRRGRYNVFISTTADVEADPDARSLNQSQMFEREKSEMRRLSREFAKHVADALSGP